MNPGAKAVGIFVISCWATIGVAQSPAPQSQVVNPMLVAKADAGDASSMLLVAKAYAAGSGVDQDDTIAADWYRKAAETGNIDAETRLAECYRDGRGVTRDMAQAAEWYRKAAEQ